MPGDVTLTNTHLQLPATGQQQYPLAVLVRGQFPDIYSGKERPAWPQPPAQPGMPPAPPAEEAPAPAPQPAPGKLLVVGNAQMLHRNFLGAGNLDFFLNSVDALALGDDIINVRGKKQIDRTMSKPSAAATILEICQSRTGQSAHRRHRCGERRAPSPGTRRILPHKTLEQRAR